MIRHRWQAIDPEIRYVVRWFLWRFALGWLLVLPGLAFLCWNYGQGW